MKKILLSLIVCVLMCFLVLAQEQGGAQGSGQGAEAQGNEPTQGVEPQGEGQLVQANTETQQQNQGEETQIQNQIQVQSQVSAGEYNLEDGKKLKVQEQANNRLQLTSGEVSAQTSMEMVQEQNQEKTVLKVKLSNGKNAEVKVMPDTASERALERLRLKVCSAENGCQIELKEVGQGEQVKAAYEIQAQKEARVLGLFKAKMQVKAQVDAENGEVIKSQKPWWSFLATEPEQ
ncbi:hypothetical protein JW756_06270 [Candidatus Woesearchaeota archaeon]|nr:hypothetical protein [Candidatus Woesearchaeota archaeon]